MVAHMQSSHPMDYTCTCTCTGVEILGDPQSVQMRNVTTTIFDSVVKRTHDEGEVRQQGANRGHGHCLAHCTQLVQQVPGLDKVRVVRTHSQQPHGDVVQRTPEHCGRSFDVSATQCKQ